MLPITLRDYLERLARETAKMSWPGQMHPILKAGTKDSVELFFDGGTFLSELQRLWLNAASLDDQRQFDAWHEGQTEQLGKHLADHNHIHKSKNGKRTGYLSQAVACKLLNTFMHQLLKHPKFQPMRSRLHLPLDRIVFNQLYRLRNDFKSLEPIREMLKNNNPYKIPYKQYAAVQRQLLTMVEEFNDSPQVECKLASRIDLNAVLWAEPVTQSLISNSPYNAH